MMKCGDTERTETFWQNDPMQAPGSSAGQPLGRGCRRRSGPGCCLWPPLAGRPVRACDAVI